MMGSENDTPGTSREGLEGVVRDALEGTSLYLVEVQVRGHAGSRVIDIYVDSDEGVTIEHCARISRQLNATLEEGELAGESYRLNVSSPGLDRPLVMPRQYRKNIGKELEVTIRENGRNVVLSGRLADADDEGILLEARRIPYADVVRAKVQLPW